MANGGSQRDGSAGNSISVIDVDRASAGADAPKLPESSSAPTIRRSRAIH